MSICPPPFISLIEPIAEGDGISITMSAQVSCPVARVGLSLLSTLNPNTWVDQIIWGDQNNKSISVAGVPRHTERFDMLTDVPRSWFITYCGSIVSVYEAGELLFQFTPSMKITHIQVILPDYPVNCIKMIADLTVSPTSCTSTHPSTSSSASASSSGAVKGSDWGIILLLVLLGAVILGAAGYGIYRLIIYFDKPTM